jgi:DNA helicase II / ATP-dependent DNA helicase PcrA
MSRDYVLHEFKTEFNPQIDYARELNPQQLAAVAAPPGPALVIAGAGSGKTRTLTYRVAYLLEQGIPAERILLLTFTNKAAAEMMRRVADLLGTQLLALWGGTFHSIGARILRVHAESLGYRPDFTILDRDDTRDLIKACMNDAGIEAKGPHFPKPEVLNEIFSLAVNTQRSISEMLSSQFSYFTEFADEIADIGRRYADRKRAGNAMDFDDLLALWLTLLQENGDALQMYQRRFQFILVDEYQDTNKLQGDLIDLMASRHHNVMAVGDDAQSIYAWRGANFLNILDFPKRYPDAKVFKIETNYRSTPEILNVANAAIAANAHQFSKNLAPSRKSGMKPALVACTDPAQQSAFIAQRIMELHDEGVSLREIAVLYRSHFHALELQLELTRRQIPFSITSGIRFFEQAHVKDATAYLKLAQNPLDEIAFKRAAQLHPGIGAKGADKLWKIFSSEIESFYRQPPAPKAPAVFASPAGRDTVTPQMVPASTANLSPKRAANANKIATAHTGPRKNPVATALETCAPHVAKKTAVRWAQFVATVGQLEEEKSPAKMLRIVIEAGYDDYLKENFPNYQVRLEDLQQLAVFANSFESTGEFLTQLALLTNVEAEDQDAKGDDERIRLSTIHQAKGLEFEAVFVIMLCDGLFPSARSIESLDGPEEERRLFYVAITRAKNELYLTYPTSRSGFGKVSSEVAQLPSRFLAEIPGDLLNKWNLKPAY